MTAYFDRQRWLDAYAVYATAIPSAVAWDCPTSLVIFLARGYFGVR